MIKRFVTRRAGTADLDAALDDRCARRVYERRGRTATDEALNEELCLPLAEYRLDLAADVGR